MKKIHWGILGAAAIAKGQMIPAIRQSEEGTVFAIASKSGKAAEFAAEFNIPKVFNSYEELIGCEEVDAIYIALPNSLHKEWIEKSIAAGKHVLCEKPIVLRENELITIFEQANEQKVHVMEAFMYRFHPQISAAKKLLDEKSIGEVLTVRSRFHFAIENKKQEIRMQPNLGGGVMWDIGCYSLNATLEFLGEDPERIQVLSGRNSQVDTHVSFQLAFPSGVLGIADCSFHSPMTQGLDIIGTEGTMSLPYVFRPDLNGGVGVIDIQKNGVTNHYEFEGNSYLYQVNAFHDAIRGNIDLPYSQYQMIQHTRILQKIVEQLTPEGVGTFEADYIRTE